MPAPEEMTPRRAGQLGDRWRLANIGALAASLAFMVAGLDLGFIVAILVAIYCSSEAADNYGWRRGYLAREREQPGRAAARVQVLRLPMEEVDGEMREPFALVIDNLRSSDQVVARFEAELTKFARECGGRGAFATDIPVDVIEQPVAGAPVTNVTVVSDREADRVAAEAVRRLTRAEHARGKTVSG